MSLQNPNTNVENDSSIETGIGGTTTAAETFDRVGSAANEFNDDAGANSLNPAGNNALEDFDEEIADDSPLKWLVPLILLILLIVLGYWFCGKTTTAVSKTSGATETGNTIAV